MPEPRSPYLRLVKEISMNHSQIFDAIESLLCNFSRRCYITRFLEMFLNFGLKGKELEIHFLFSDFLLPLGKV